MFPPPWKDAARKNRRSGHVDCQADFQRQTATKQSLSSPALLFSEQHQPMKLRRPVHDAPTGAVGDGGRVRFEFQTVPHGGSSRAETGGEINYYTIHAGGPQHRRTIGSGTATKKRKRAPSTRRGPCNGRAGVGGVSSVSSASQCSASIDSDSKATFQVEKSGPGDFAGVGSTWRDKLLLQALRETGEEMKRRRQTHREIRARRAAEEEGAAMRSGGSGGRGSSHGSSQGSGSAAIATLQAGGEGRWKPPLSRRTRDYLATNPAGVLRTTNGNNTHQDATNADARSGPVKPEGDEPGRRKMDDARTLRQRRRTRRTPSARRSRSRAGNAIPTPTCSEERKVLPTDGTNSTGRGGTSEAGGGSSASGSLGRGKTSDQAGLATAGTSSVAESELEGLSAGETVRFSEGVETAAAAAAAAAAVAKPGRRNSNKGSRSRRESGAGALQGSGGVGTESVSLTTSVEVTVLDGISEGGVSSSCGDDRFGGSDEVACGKNTTSSRQRYTSKVGNGVELPPLTNQQPRRSTVNLVRPAGVEGGAEESAESSAGLVPDRSPAADAALVNGEIGRRRSTVLELRQALADSKRATDEAVEGDQVDPAEAGSEAMDLKEEWRQETPPAPFRGTFWDDEDGVPILPPRRVSHILHSGKRYSGTFCASSLAARTKVGRPTESVPSEVDETTRRASTRLQPSTEAGHAEDGMGLHELSDGGIGRKALSAHTKNEDNRRQFFQLYRRMARQVEIVGDTGVLSEEGHTPRQEFIRKMLSMGRVPVPILLRDPSALQDLNLAHRGLGDDVMCAAAEVLTRLPHINTLNVSDNRLTDRSLCKLCSLVVGMPGLKSLDLSCNKVDEAAAIIRSYLAHPSCSLQTLSLRSADVDDNECCCLMEAISRNQSLTKLDVSENKIGQNEMLNAVQPDLVTGGEGIAETLAGNVALKELNLSWNNLRQESAAAIGRALTLNRGLVSLNLAHNAFNDLPSQEVGDSLRTNSTLQSLDLSYNGLTPAAAIVIASACKANSSLTRLTLCGNRLGRQGSAALLSAIRKRTSAGKGRKVSPLLLRLEGCDCESDSPHLFDVDEPSGEYKLDMSLPYSRMVASELVALSQSKKGFEIEGIWMAKDVESLERAERRELVRTDREASTTVSRLKNASPCARAIAEVARQAVSHSSDSGGGDGNGAALAEAVLNGYERSRAKEQVMKLLEAVDLKPSRSAMERALDEMEWGAIKGENDAFIAVFTAAFRVFDTDRSGSLEVKELQELFQGLGCEMDEKRCRTLISVYDLDRSGVLETEEFVTWMMLEHVKDLTYQKGRLMETPKARPWPVPREGAYAISFRASRFPGEYIHVESADGLAAMVENIRHMNTATERLRMFENAAMHTDMLLTAKQAEMMAVLVERDQDRVMTAERLLPQVVNSDERAQFLESFLNDGQRLRLAVRMKGLFRAVMGNPTGFYMLDLASAQGRMTAIKLGEVANAERCLATTRGVCDTSQKGNRMMFRNEVMDTVPQNLTVEWFVKLPRRGIIRVDVVSTERPRLSVRPLSDARFESVKDLLSVDDDMRQITRAYDLLEQQRPSENPGVRIWQRGTASGQRSFKSASEDPASSAQPLAKAARAGASAAAAGEAARSKTSNSDDNNNNSSSMETAATTPTTAAGVSADNADPKPKKADHGAAAGGRHLAAAASMAELPYHYDPLSVFRTKGRHPKVVVPAVEIPDCIIGSQAINHWQQFHASSHFCLEYVEVAKRAQAAHHAGVGGSSANLLTSGAGDGGGVPEGGGRGGGASSSAPAASAAGAGGAGTAHGGGDRPAVSGGGGGAGAGAAHGPTRLYRWVFHRLVVLQTAAAAAWYTCQQAMEIASAFPWQDFGRVQALIIVFSRIEDVENFSEVVLSAVRSEEKRELEHRLGILNVLNPVRPDGPYLLDLKVWEEREWAKILIKLAVEEPGPNWAHETYTHARGTPNIQGWLLPESWTRDDEDMGGDGGPRRAGVLCLRYITDVSLGCMAKWEVRKALRSRTLGGTVRVL